MIFIYLYVRKCKRNLAGSVAYAPVNTVENPPSNPPCQNATKIKNTIVLSKMNSPTSQGGRVETIVVLKHLPRPLPSLFVTMNDDKNEGADYLIYIVLVRAGQQSNMGEK